MIELLYYCCPYVPFLIDLAVLIPFWRLVAIVDTNDYMTVYMIAVNIPYTIRLVPQYINILAPTPPSRPPDIPLQQKNDTHPHAVNLPFVETPTQLFFTMMSAFMVITICYGAFNVFICMLQEIRRGKTTKCNTWAPIIVMMAITQGVLITIYKFHYLSESMILFLVVYYVAVSVIMAVVVAVFLHRPRPNDNTWVKRRQPMKSKFSRFLLFCLIAVLPSMLHTHHLSAKLMDWYFGGVEVLTAIYTFTDYMLHPWIFNIAGMLLLEPFR
ncbi:hypothetical protein COOONC_11586 [Cooperia oncophora]